MFSSFSFHFSLCLALLNISFLRLVTFLPVAALLCEAWDYLAAIMPGVLYHLLNRFLLIIFLPVGAMLCDA